MVPFPYCTMGLTFLDFSLTFWMKNHHTPRTPKPSPDRPLRFCHHFPWSWPGPLFRHCSIPQSWIVSSSRLHVGVTPALEFTKPAESSSRRSSSTEHQGLQCPLSPTSRQHGLPTRCSGFWVAIPASTWCHNSWPLPASPDVPSLAWISSPASTPGILATWSLLQYTGAGAARAQPVAFAFGECQFLVPHRMVARASARAGARAAFSSSKDAAEYC